MTYDSDDDDHQNRGVYAYIYANQIMRCMPFRDNFTYTVSVLYCTVTNNCMQLHCVLHHLATSGDLRIQLNTLILCVP